MEDVLDRNWYADDAATFGDRLAAAREAQGISQDTLARRLGVKRASLEAWENDLREPRANRLSMLAGILDVSMSWLLTGEGQGVEPAPDAASPEMSELLNELRVLRTEMQRSSERMGILEKRLKKAVVAPA